MARVDSLKTKFILTELDDYSAIKFPLKTTGRIKYSCFDVSQSFLVFGATSGGLYVFKREPCTFIQLLPNKEGPISLLSISPDERLFAFSSQRGVVCVLERTEGVSTRLLNRSTEHSGTCVTALQWANTSDQIFIGDSIGRLSVINVSLFMSKNIFQIPAFIFMQLDSGVVQISCRDDRLLISTLTHCYVCDTAKEQYRQIGTKPRDGEYGACYLNDKIFCARPGSRLWEVDLEGTVQSTHQFKQLLATKPSYVVTEGCLFNGFGNGDESYCWPEQSFNFIKLSTILKFLFTFKNDGIYVFDPEKVDVVLWSNHYKDIIDAKCLDNLIYVWTDSNKLYALTIVTLDQCLLRLFFREKYNICLELLMHFLEELLESKEFLLKLNPLIDLKNYIECNNDIIKLLNKIDSVTSLKEKATRLDSGIFMLDNHHVCQKLLENKQEYNINSSSSHNNIVGGTEYTQSDILPSSDSSMLLPELIRSSGQINLIGANGSNESTNAMNGIYMVPQIPFLPLSSPDIIHDALLEIGCNVSDKLITGTKTLKDKWQVLEGKLKLSTKIDSYIALNLKSSSDDDDGLNKQPMNSDINIKYEGDCNDDDDDDSIIVTNKMRCNNKKLNQQKFIWSELIDVCCELHKLENDKRISLLNKLLDSVLTTYKKYNDYIIENNNCILKTNTTTNTTVSAEEIKYLPFHQFLPENYVLIVKHLFHESFKTNELLKWLNMNLRQGSNVLFNELFSSITSIKKKHPTILSNVYSNEILNIDAMLSLILIIFSELLDPYTILQDLSAADLPCVYLSWCTIMERFQDGALRYFSRNNVTNQESIETIDKNNDENINVGCKEWPMPLLLNAMFLLLRLDQVQPAVKMGEEGNISLSTVSYIIFKLSSHLEESGMSKYDADKKCANLFLLYVMKILASEIVNIDFDNRGLLMHIEESFIILNEDLQFSVCHCGFPKVNLLKSYTKNNYCNVIKYPNVAEILLNYYRDNRVKPDLLSHMPLNNEKNDENFWSLLGSMDEGHIQGSECLEHIKRICSVAPPLLLWFVKNKLKQDLFTVRTVLILQLGYLHELDGDNAIDIDKWEQIVGLNCRIERGECCFCNRKHEPVPGINWSQLAVLILRTIGPGATLMILKKFIGELSHGIIYKRFYQACMLSSYVESRANYDIKKDVMINTINCVTGDSNSFSFTAVASGDCKAGISLTQALSTDVITEPERVLSKLLSTDNYHWGTAIDLETGCCGLCSLSLGARCLLLDTGLRAFKCGHAFHVVCLSIKQTLKTCPICTR